MPFLRGVELKEFMSEDPGKTFAELRARGWIDTQHPENSKLLAFINRKPEESSEAMDRVRASESEALRMWITAAVNDPKMLDVPVPNFGDLRLEDAVIRHVRQDKILDRFVSSVWSQLERCAGCHSPERNAKQVEKNGEQMTWIVPKSPAATLKLLTDRKLIDTAKPEESLLLTKPLALVEHGAGIKFPEGGETDKAWRSFLIDYSHIMEAAYSKEKTLPADYALHHWRTPLHLRISGWPEDFAGRLIQVQLFRKLENDSWESKPLATGESKIAKGKLSWGNSISVYVDDAQRTALRSEQVVPLKLLPAGSYRLRAIDATDTEHKREVGAIDIEVPWKSGHSEAASIEFAKLQRPH
ncbi:MAG: hypothetical protein U0892_01240 [Pirellulales bacterium]